MPVLEPLRGLRVVADPAALDGARWSGERDPAGAPIGEVIVLRFAPDEAFAIGARHVEADDPHAIVAEERGFVGASATLRDLEPIERQVDWELPMDGRVGQGSIAGVPAKLVVWSADERALVVTHAAYAATLAERLGWSWR